MPPPPQHHPHTHPGLPPPPQEDRMGCEAAPDKEAEVEPGAGPPGWPAPLLARGTDLGDSWLGAREARAPPGGGGGSTPPPAQPRLAAPGRAFG